MKISTKGRYAVRLMLELAKHGNEDYLSVKSISESQGISAKYLEQIVILLTRARYVKSLRGSQGGYKLTKPPEEYTIGMILRITEGSLAPVSCLEDDPNECPLYKGCVTVKIWSQVYKAINDVVDHVTLADCMEMTGF